MKGIISIFWLMSEVVGNLVYVWKKISWNIRCLFAFIFVAVIVEVAIFFTLGLWIPAIVVIISAPLTVIAGWKTGAWMLRNER
jgi:hypothetical protein